MKELYVCEKCGATYEDYTKACNCENGHLEPYGCYTKELNTRMIYNPGVRCPETVVLAFRYWGNDGEEWVYERYKLDKSMKSLEREEIEAERKIREEKEKEERERWYAEREARKAREAQAAQEAQEQTEAVGA